MKVDITKFGTKLRVSAPYNSRFITEARNLGGKWIEPEWVFDIRDEDRVRGLCLKYYGSDGITRDMVTLRITYPVDGEERTEPISIWGRTIAKAWGRDSGAKLGEGVVLLEGGFGSGGSVKNWCTEVYAGTTVLVRDFPRVFAEELCAKEDTKNVYSIEQEKPVIDRTALIAERERLTARIEEISILLSQKED